VACEVVRLSLVVRTANLRDAGDAASLVAVLDSYAADPVGGGRPLADGVRATLAAKLDEQPNAVVFVATENDVCVGIAICFIGFSTFAARPLLNVHDLAVLPACRGRGIGRALLAAVERHARERGCCKLTLEVQDSNARALGLYRSFGFDDLTYGDSGPTRFLAKPLPD
jgi:ribosomal protein S18 acetylase RimI-like enzyme